MLQKLIYSIFVFLSLDYSNFYVFILIIVFGRTCYGTTVSREKLPMDEMRCLRTFAQRDSTRSIPWLYCQGSHNERMHTLLNNVMMRDALYTWVIIWVKTMLILGKFA